MAKGFEFPVFNLNNHKFGINICYDLNFPDCAKAVSRQGAKVLICPSNNMLSKKIAEKWKGRHNTSRSLRAIESGLWIISSDVTGKFEDKISYGPTALINPNGDVISQLPLMEPGLLTVEVPDI